MNDNLECILLHQVMFISDQWSPQCPPLKQMSNMQKIFRTHVVDVKPFN